MLVDSLTFLVDLYDSDWTHSTQGRVPFGERAIARFAVDQRASPFFYSLLEFDAHEPKLQMDWSHRAMRQARVA